MRKLMLTIWFVVGTENTILKSAAVLLNYCAFDVESKKKRYLSYALCVEFLTAYKNYHSNSRAGFRWYVV